MAAKPADETTTPEEAVPVPEPEISFAGGGAREQTVPLAWPLQVGEARFDGLVIRRLTGGQVGALQDAIEAGGGSDASLLSFMTGQPLRVIEALDVDDFTTLREAATGFLPREMREGYEARLSAALASASGPGDVSSPISPTHLDGPAPSS